MNNEFRETKLFFENLLQYDYTKSPDWGDWMKYPDDQKSAILFLAFYSEITLAWEKTKSYYTPTCDGVSIVLQYLEKNVPLLMSDSKKFSSRYIYRVAYNCLYCECHDRGLLKNAYMNEVSADQLGSDEDSEFSYYDILSDESENIENKFFNSMSDDFKYRLWGVLDQVDIETEIIIEKLLGTDSDVIWQEIRMRSDYSEYESRYLNEHPGQTVKLIPFNNSRASRAIDRVKTQLQAIV